MGKSLNEVKRQLSRKYLGKSGIHGIGTRPAEQAISVYLKPCPANEREELREELEKEAAPFKVILIEDQPPRIH